MRRALYCSTVALTLLAIAALSDSSRAVEKDDGTAELSKFEGTWTFVAIETRGAPLPAEKMKKFQAARMVFKGNVMKIVKPDEKEKVQTISLDPAKNPKQIDITRKAVDGATRTALGIYQLDGNTLKICADDSGKLRPTEFVSKEKTAISAITLKREEPAPR